MKLYFLRHGEAGAAASDIDRELTEIGERDSHNIGLLCRNAHIHFSHVLSSPITRAKQTAQLVVKEHTPVAIEETEHLTPDADPRNLFELLRSYTSESRILCVTHEPFVSSCISVLISGTESTHIIMKPASFACVETVGTPSRGNGKLVWLLNAEIIKNFI
jgi:phosphohistidine phosphatase